MQRLQRHKLVRKPGVFAWLGAMAVVLLQLQLASHFDVDHASNADFGDVCEVCLKLDASGKVPEASQPVVAVPGQQSVPSVAAVSPTFPLRARTHSARAPPLA